MTQTNVTHPGGDRATDKNSGIALRPFHVKVPEADLLDLRRRLAASRFPDKETVADLSQGVQLTASR